MSTFSAPVTIDLGVRETAMQIYLQEGERKAASLSNRDPIRLIFSTRRIFNPQVARFLGKSHR